jgi:hypothetical protein
MLLVYLFFLRATVLTADVGADVQQADEPFIAGVLTHLGIIIGPTVQVGLGCSSLSVGSSW